jgi:hypothetical protein
MTLFSETLDDKERYQKLLQYRGEKAQLILDTMQAVKNTIRLIYFIPV